MKTYQAIDPKMPENIALSFSGGGFRAASFSLGCLSYLEQLDFNDKPFMDLVKFASSASGGTITLLSYSVAKRNGEEFKDYYKWMVNEVLYGEKLVNQVFDIMRSLSEWNSRPNKSRNLINAFSIAYDLKIFKGKKFGFLWENGGIPDICVNTTEFQNGLLFRFQNNGRIGNNFIKGVLKENLQKIKLGDILACSSCFPVGFEPFVYPKDFSYDGLDREALERAVEMNNQYVNNEKKSADLFSLMDGGIDDNQGIDSFMNAEERLERKNKFGYDLYMTCDVSSNYTNGYQYPSQRKAGWFGRRSLLFYFGIIFFLLALGILGAVFDVCKGLSYAVIGITSFFTLLIIFVGIKLISFKKEAEADHSTAVLLILKHLSFFLRLDISILVQEIYARLTSAGELAAVIFLKKIRRASYGGLFQRVTPVGDRRGIANPEGPRVTNLKFWGQFSVMNAIYMISAKNKAKLEENLKGEVWAQDELEVLIDGKMEKAFDFMTPSVKMRTVADLAAKMETTLWYDAHHIEQGQPKAVVACGQFTTCYNLLRWSLRFKDAPGQTIWEDFQQNLTIQYTKFKDDPYWLFNEYSK